MMDPPSASTISWKRENNNAKGVNAVDIMMIPHILENRLIELHTPSFIRNA
jgi:hypothetical protein